MTIWEAPAMLAVIVWLSTPPGTLARAAQHEAVRRALMPKSVAAFSLYDWPVSAIVAGVAPPVADSPPTPGALASAATPSGGATAGVSGRTSSDEPARDEGWWRARSAAARSALERDQTLADAVQSHINALRTDVASRDDPAQQAQLRLSLEKALGELERLTKQIAADRQAIVDLQEEARKRGVPADWIRDGPISSARSP